MLLLSLDRNIGTYPAFTSLLPVPEAKTNLLRLKRLHKVDSRRVTQTVACGNAAGISRTNFAVTRGYCHENEYDRRHRFHFKYRVHYPERKRASFSRPGVDIATLKPTRVVRLCCATVTEFQNTRTR